MTRPTFPILALLALLALPLALSSTGCGSGGEGTPTAPPSPASDSEPNDFAPLRLDTLRGADIQIPGTASSDADVDWFSITTTATANLLVSLGWSGGADLDVAITDTDGVVVQHRDTAGNPERCVLSSLPAGTYLVRVGSRTSAAQAYTLTVGAR